MSEANSIAGTVGTWVSPFLLLLLTNMVAYMTRHITPSDDTERKRLLRQTARDVGHLRRDYHETLQVLLRIEKIAIEVKNESGDVLVLQSADKSFYPRQKKARFRVLMSSTTLPSTTIITMLRTPLGPISSNRRRGPELTPYKRGIINGAYRHGCTPTYIVSAENTPLNTVKKTILHASQHPNGITKPRCGRPLATTLGDRRLIIRIARANPRITYEDLKKETLLDISHKTFYRVLKEYGLTNWLAKQRPLLTPEVAVKRLAWCRVRLSWKWEEWSKVIWSDECSVERGTGKERAWVFWMPYEKWTKEMIQPKKKGRRVTVMVWGAYYRKGEQSNLL